MHGEWVNVQAEIAECTLCTGRLPRLRVNCPPGQLYPDDVQPPDRVKVFFVGVAPPQRARHFYTDSRDKLKLGLFSVLNRLGKPCNDVNDFLRHGFFLLHSAKCARENTPKPSRRVARLCSSHYLKREIEQLRSDAVCWLSKKVGYEVCQALSGEWDVDKRIVFGEVTQVTINGRRVHILATKKPIRGWESETQRHLTELFTALDSNCEIR